MGSFVLLAVSSEKENPPICSCCFRSLALSFLVLFRIRLSGRLMELCARVRHDYAMCQWLLRGGAELCAELVYCLVCKHSRDARLERLGAVSESSRNSTLCNCVLTIVSFECNM